MITFPAHQRVCRDVNVKISAALVVQPKHWLNDQNAYIDDT